MLSWMFVIINIVITMKDFNKGFLLYMVFSFISPHIYFGNTVLSYETVVFIPMFLFFLVNRKRITFTLTHCLIYLNVLLLMISTLLSIMKYGTPILWGSVIGVIKVSLLTMMLIELFKKRWTSFSDILLTVVVINAVVVIIQFTVPQTVNVFYDLYFKDSLTPLSYYLETGGFSRATGTFGSPINLGSFSLVSFAYFFSKILTGNKKKSTFLGMVLSLISGFFSITKTFLIGALLIFVLGVIIKLCIFIYSRVKLNLFLIYGFFAFTSIIYLMGDMIVKLMEKRSFPINYYLQYIYNPSSAFSTRYSSDGLLSESLQVFLDNIFLGVGFTQPIGEFLGDSSYVSILHNNGLIGAIPFMLILIILLLGVIKNRDIIGLFIIVSLFLTAVAYTAFTDILGALLIAYITVRNLSLFNDYKQTPNNEVSNGKLGTINY